MNIWGGKVEIGSLEAILTVYLSQYNPTKQSICPFSSRNVFHSETTSVFRA